MGYELFAIAFGTVSESGRASRGAWCVVGHVIPSGDDVRVGVGVEEQPARISRLWLRPLSLGPGPGRGRHSRWLHAGEKRVGAATTGRAPIIDDTVASIGSSRTGQMASPDLYPRLIDSDAITTVTP